MKNGKDAKHLPPPKAHWTDDTKFNVCIGVVIIWNAAVVGFETETNGWEAGASDEYEVQLIIVNQFFALFYFAEMIIRIYYNGIKYFKSPWYLSDFVLTLLCLAENWVLIFIEYEGLKSFTVLRLLRVLRVAKLVRVFFIFRDLWFVLQGMVKVSIVLFWTVIVLFIVFSAVAPLCRLLISPEEDENHNFPTIFFETHLTLLKIVTLDDWADSVVWPLILHNNLFMVICFILFIMITSFGFMSIVLGITVHEQEAIANANRREMEKRVMSAKLVGLNAIRLFFEKYDANKNGSIEYTELQHAMEDPKMLSLFKRLEFPTLNARMLFVMISETGTTEGAITYDSFVKGCSQLVVTESATDRFLRASYNLKWMAKTLQIEEERVRLLVDDICEFTDQFDQLADPLEHLRKNTTDPLVNLRKTDMASLNSTLKSNKARNARRYHELLIEYRKRREQKEADKVRAKMLKAKEEEAKRLARLRELQDERQGKKW